MIKFKKPCSGCKKPLFVDDVELIGINYLGTKLTYWFNCNHCNSTMVAYDKDQHEILKRAKKGTNFNDHTKPAEDKTRRSRRYSRNLA